MKTQHLLIVVGVVVAVLLLVSLRNRPVQAPVASGPQQTAAPQATVPQAVPPQTAVPQAAVSASRQGSSLRKTDAGGVAWSLDLAGGMSFQALGANAATAGAPIVVKTDVQRSGASEVSVGLRLEGQAGEQYRPVVKKNGTSVPAPALRIVNEAGKVVAQGNFKYG
jgi:hypothetical protein